MQSLSSGINRTPGRLSRKNQENYEKMVSCSKLQITKFLGSSYQAIDNKRPPPLNKRSSAFRVIFEMLISAPFEFQIFRFSK